MFDQLEIARRPEVCTRCQTLLAENEQLTEEISGLMYSHRKISASAAALQRELTRARKEDAQSKDIEFVLTRWRRLCGHPRAKCPPDGDAWKAVKRALGPWEYSLEAILEVVEGVALAPYDAGYGQRKITGTAKERKDDLGYALRDERKIAMFRDIACRGHKATVGQLRKAYDMTWASHDVYARLLLAAVSRVDSADLLIAREWHYSVDVTEAGNVAAINSARRAVV